MSSRPSDVRQGGAQQVADADHHFAVAPVEHGDLAGRAVEEGGQCGFVAADRQVEQIGIEAGDQRAGAAGNGRGETGILGEDQRVVGEMVRLGGRERSRCRG